MKNIQSRKASDLSDVELKEYADEHVYHEISMILGCLHLLVLNLTLPQPEMTKILKNTQVESFGLHLRNVIDFLYPKRRVPTDITAEIYRPPGAVALPPISSSLDIARKRTHKELMHLTTDRLPSGDPAKNWSALDLAREISSLLAKFANSAVPERLGEKVQKMISLLAQQTRMP